MQRGYRHKPMDCSRRILLPGSLSEREKGLVDHEIDLVLQYSCSMPKPKAERQIHGAVSVTVRNPLHEQPSGPGKFIQTPVDTFQVPNVHLSQFSMNDDSMVGHL